MIGKGVVGVLFALLLKDADVVDEIAGWKDRVVDLATPGPAKSEI
jgi:hypothetical protein